MVFCQRMHKIFQIKFTSFIIIIYYLLILYMYIFVFISDKIIKLTVFMIQFL